MTENEPPELTRRNCRDKYTQEFAEGKRIKEFQASEQQAYKRLEILEAALTQEALLGLPGSWFEALGGSGLALLQNYGSICKRHTNCGLHFHKELVNFPHRLPDAF